jgi:NAD(P)-dependent dehydrogenase (short-subunit alcohol dehydrogenase family)
MIERAVDRADRGRKNVDRIDLSDSVALVTGGGGSLGTAYCRELARRGARVVVNDISPEQADRVVAEIREAGGEAIPSYTSVDSERGAQELLENVMDVYGEPGIVVCNAGILRNGLIESLDPGKVEPVLAVNLLGPLYLCRAAWPYLRQNRSGRIVLTSSSGGLFPMTGHANYGAAKAGIFGLCSVLAAEGQDAGILVNGVIPMATTTLGVGDPIPGHKDKYPAWVADFFAGRKSPDYVAPLITYLVSRECSATGGVYFGAFGHFARIYVGEGAGWTAADPSQVEAEDIAANFQSIKDVGAARVPIDFYDHVESIARTMQGREP